MKHNYFAAALLAAAMTLSMSSAFAADKMLADRHVERGVACASCHGDKTPAPGAQVATAQCNACHTSLDAVAERTKKLDPNPHYNHLVGLDCTDRKSVV